MGHSGLVILQARRFIHTEISAIDTGVVEKLRVPNSLVPVHLLAGIAAHPHRLAIQQHSHGQVFHQLDVHVQVADGNSIDHVAQVFDGVGATGRTGLPGVMHQAHIIVHGRDDVLLGKLGRSHLAIPVELIVLVGPLPVEPAGRSPQVDAQDLVNHIQRLVLGLAHRIQARLVGVALANRLRPLPQLVVEDEVHAHGVAGTLRLRHHFFGHRAVLLDQADEHIPLPAIVDRALQQPGNGPVIYRPTGGFDYRLQQKVGPLQLVPKHDVILAVLELFQIQDILGLGAKQV